MVDENTIANGIASENHEQTVESFYDVDERENRIKMNEKIKVLEESMANENEKLRDLILQPRSHS
ncbi:hypothetical protein JCGZ_13479 [Jatropha curcas]|uniref:Uncharacterized protein n=1 Tax=Jatropha curcas TaxID=180498 RepID=A0A067LFK0_JATCU|nr:hypothetical protein JCGZ_13479 [Jatropha curcas]